MGKKSKKVNSHGYRGGDVVWLRDIDVVLRYDKKNDAWYPATGDHWSCHNENFDSAVLLLPFDVNQRGWF